MKSTWLNSQFFASRKCTFWRAQMMRNCSATPADFSTQPSPMTASWNPAPMGGVSAQQKLLIAPIAAKVKASVMPAFAEGLEVRAAQLHNDAGMVGAVYYFRQTMEEKE